MLLQIASIKFLSIEFATWSMLQCRDKIVISKEVTALPGCWLNPIHTIRAVIKTTSFPNDHSAEFVFSGLLAHHALQTTGGKPRFERNVAKVH